MMLRILDIYQQAVDQGEEVMIKMDREGVKMVLNTKSVSCVKDTSSKAGVHDESKDVRERNGNQSEKVVEKTYRPVNNSTQRAREHGFSYMFPKNL